MRSIVPDTDAPPISPANSTLTVSVFLMRAGVLKPNTVPSAKFTSKPILVKASVLLSLSDVDIILVNVPSQDKVSVSGSAQASWIDTTIIRPINKLKARTIRIRFLPPSFRNHSYQLFSTPATRHQQAQVPDGS